MKKLILFLCVIGATLLMTSCMEEGSNNYTESSFVYLETDDLGNTYGKTFSRYSPMRFITHSSMMAMQTGTFKVMAYSWSEENGTTPLMVSGQNVQADNVQPISKVIDIPRTLLTMKELPEQENPTGFDEIVAPLYSDYRNFMGDHWVIEYSYTAKDGEEASVEFYKREGETEKGEIVIDIRLTLSGTPKS
ncbi:MAG: hypothetical protein LBB62_01320, partial [Proteiniphilum sp.]|nr:hypothetical protein [Proteiniphilum sp.]